MQSSDREEQVLLNEDERLRSIVRRFQMRAGIRYPDNTDDLCQEARVALQSYLRRLEPDEQMGDYFIYVLHALVRYVQQMAAVHIPEKKFKREIRNVFIYPLDTAAGEANSGPFEDDILDYIDMNLFIKTLDERDRAILIMRLAGYRQKEIAEVLGISESQVSRRIDQIGRSYLCYTERRACAS